MPLSPRALGSTGLTRLYPSSLARPHQTTHLLAAYDELPFVCSPSELSHQLLSIGQILRGDRVIKSDIVVRTMVQTPCELLCSKPIHQVDVALARHMIQDNYQVECVTIDKRYEIGFPLGYYNQKLDVFELHNHLLLNIVYKEYSRDNIVIVGFEIYPKSIQTASGMCLSGRDSQYMDPFYLPESGHTTIDWTYSVQWQHDDTVDWPHRWDKYLTTRTTSIHWYSVANSIVILLLMTAAVAAAMMHTLSREYPFITTTMLTRKKRYIVSTKTESMIPLGGKHCMVMFSGQHQRITFLPLWLERVYSCFSVHFLLYSQLHVALFHRQSKEE
ncbi:hypothetical protein BASA81_014724 [Batrachochytrium salamandrivorans]|nr:hypothetical protein BASA81_014724 [Batrachochytrium salamandrivorans]